MRVCAIIAAAGHGSRLGGSKLWTDLGGRPLGVWALAALARSDRVDDVIIACAAADVGRCEDVAQSFGASKVRSVIVGGEVRQESVARAFAALPGSVDRVLVHDGARPFIKADLIERAVQASVRTGAAIAAVPVKDTIKRALRNERIVGATIAREGLWAAQTPQVFARQVLARAYAAARIDGAGATDEAMLVEKLGVAIDIVDGDEDNIKVTTPYDLTLARYIARDRQAPAP